MGRSQRIIIITLSTALLAVLAVIAAVACLGTGRTSGGQFTKPSFEPLVVVGSPNIPDESLSYQTLWLSDGFQVSLCTNLFLQRDSNNVDIYFTSGPDNTVLSRIILLDETGAELGSSGLLKPGEYVQSVALERIPPKSSSILAKILSYEPQTYYSMGSASAEIYLHIA